ncbi:MAG: tyrosine-type recombinase/integrase [Candidatus Omnitrophota bacterium]|nr:tyrosine-type recombinase/integrase [Candidatus Omnitrophota bacterium]
MSLSLEDGRDRYLDFLLAVKGVSHARAQCCKVYLNRLIRFLQPQGVTRLDQAQREHLAAYEAAVMAEPLKSASKLEILQVAMLWFGYLHDYHDCATNPALVIDLPRKEQLLPRTILATEEFLSLLSMTHPKSLLGLRDRCIFQVLYASAMRPDELCRMKLSQVDLANQQFLIERPKNKRDRIVHIDRFTAQDLRTYLARVSAWLGSRGAADNFFVNAYGGPLTRNALSSYFTKAYAPRFKKRWKKPITLYALRHTSATDWLDAAAAHRRDVLPYVQRQLGHESMESTAIYTHVAIEPLRRMFKDFHPRERQWAALAKIPSSPDDLRSQWDAQRKPPPPEPPSST